MNKIINPGKAKFGIGLLVIIVIFEYVIEELIHMPTWPTMIPMMMFMLAEEDIKVVPKVIVGGALGILSQYVSPVIVKALSPSIGYFWAKMVFVIILVSCIILFKQTVGLVFNTYAFILCSITSIAKAGTADANLLAWLALEVVGGTLVCYAVYYMRLYLVVKPAEKKAAAAAAAGETKSE